MVNSNYPQHERDNIAAALRFLGPDCVARLRGQSFPDPKLANENGQCAVACLVGDEYPLPLDRHLHNLGFELESLPKEVVSGLATIMDLNDTRQLGTVHAVEELIALAGY